MGILYDFTQRFRQRRRLIHPMSALRLFISLVTILLLTPLKALPDTEPKSSPSPNALRSSTSVDVASNASNGLADLADKIRPGFLLGSFAAGLNSAPKDDAILKKFFKHNFNIVTVGIYMQSTQREKGVYDYNRSDALVKFAQVNQIKIYFHPLIGGVQYTPKWVNEGHFSAPELRQIMKERITTILNLYRDKVAYGEVVNEALEGTGLKPDGQFNWLEKSARGDHVWMKTMGMYQGKKYLFPQYLVDAFRIAREAGGPGLKLHLNEYGNASTQSLRGPAFLKLIQAMREEGMPVDGAGLQMHFNLKHGKLLEDGSKAAFNLGSFDAMLQEYLQAGIDVHITEFDIHLPVNPTEQDYQLQGKYYSEVLRHAIASPAVKSFKTWGFTDKYSWKPNNEDGHPLMLDAKFQPKPAYLMSLEFLKTLTQIPQ